MKRRPPSKRKAIAFRLAALLLGLSPLLFGELIVRCSGWRQPIPNEDPFVGFSEIRPLFVLNDGAARFAIPAARLMFFRPESFSAKKTDDEFRIFCLGGSTVQGRPYAIETSFTTWLELNLQAADGDRRWEVVNCGGVSYASYRLAPIMQEVLGHRPDLLILYTGHNEFLEQRSYDHIKRLPALVTRSYDAASRSRLFQWVRHHWQTNSGEAGAAASDQRTRLTAEVNARLDYRGALADYHRDDDARVATIEHFRFNLRRMIGMARDAGVPLILVNPACNLKDCPPFKFENRTDLSPDQQQKFDRLWEQAKQAGDGDVRHKIRLLQQAIAIDDRHAGVHYHLGKCYEAAENYQAAGRSYLRAKDEDICPLRIIGPMRQLIRDEAHDANVPLVDVEEMFQTQSPHALVGDNLLVDHVHPSIHAHQRIADALLSKMIDIGFLDRADNYHELRTRLFREHYNSLDLVYFARGQRRLEGLTRWSQGRSRLIRPNSSGRISIVGRSWSSACRTME